MPKVEANGITINYEQQGDGETLILIPSRPPIMLAMPSKLLSTAKHYTCISVDARGAGETDKPE